jgi:hypothetical protein
MKTKDEILSVLPNFYGTEHWTRYSPMLFPKVLLTDGAAYIAQSCDAYWLMDMISSHLPSVKDGWCVAMLGQFGDKWEFKLIDDVPANRIWAKQTIEATDFPLDSIKFYAQSDGEHWVIMLPSEY